jgi:hypothetical protein
LITSGFPTRSNRTFSPGDTIVSTFIVRIDNCILHVTIGPILVDGILIRTVLVRP